jgi:hypothetical protein
MNDKPKSIWKKNWSLPRSVTGWLIFLASLALFISLFGALVMAGIQGDLMPAIVVSVISVVVILLFLLVRWMFRPRNRRRTLFGLACLITLIALFYAEEDWRGWHAWKKFKTKWEAKGEKFDLVSLAPPPVPDEQNFALTPLLKPIFDYSRTTNGLRRRDTNGCARLESLSAEWPLLGSTNYAVSRGNLEKGTFADLEACRNFYRGNTNYPQPVKPGTPAEDILVALGKFDPEVKELREAAAARPYSRFPIEYDCESPAAILLPHLVTIKRLSTLVEMRVIAELETGQSQEAFAELKLGFRLSDSIREEPFLIDHYLWLAALGFDLQTLREGLVRHAWGDAQLAELEKYFASVDVLAEYKHAMRGERACSLGDLDYARRQGFKFDWREALGDASPSGRILNLMPRGWYYQNALAIARWHQDSTLVAVDEHAHRVLPAVAERQEHVVADMRAGPYNIFAKLVFLPGLAKASMKSALMQTYVDAARVACALERFRLANGPLPDTLDALVPRFLDKIPNDVIDGRPLRYRKAQDGGYVLYSVGWNKTDDGGKLAWTQETRPSVDNKRGDWVWQYPAK